MSKTVNTRYIENASRKSDGITANLTTKNLIQLSNEQSKKYLRAWMKDDFEYYLIVIKMKSLRTSFLRQYRLRNVVTETRAERISE